MRVSWTWNMLPWCLEWYMSLWANLFHLCVFCCYAHVDLSDCYDGSTKKLLVQIHFITYLYEGHFRTVWEAGFCHCTMFGRSTVELGGHVFKSWQGVGKETAKGRERETMKTDGMNVQGLPLTGERVNKIWYNLVVHPTFMNHSETQSKQELSTYLQPLNAFC